MATAKKSTSIYITVQSRELLRKMAKRSHRSMHGELEFIIEQAQKIL